MRSKAFIGTGFVALAMALTACGSSGGGSGSSDSMTSMSSPMASGMHSPMTSEMMTDSSDMAGGDDSSGMGHGTFEGLNGKSVQGKVTIEHGTLKLTGFSSDEGPDLHLYLTNGTDEAAVGKGTELGKVAFDTATQSFDLQGADISEFTDVVVHCDKAKAVFGAAMLSS